AEDGIRDFHVTGVQTCALPILNLNCNLVFTKRPKYYICPIPSKCMKMKNPINALVAVMCILLLSSCGILGKKNKGGALPQDGQRSEERRVGKECRSRWSSLLES